MPEVWFSGSYYLKTKITELWFQFPARITDNFRSNFKHITLSISKNCFKWYLKLSRLMYCKKIWYSSFYPQKFNFHEFFHALEWIQASWTVSAPSGHGQFLWHFRFADYVHSGWDAGGWVELTKTTWPITNTADLPTQVWALLLQLTSYPWDFGDFQKCRSSCSGLELYLPLASFPERFGPFNRPRVMSRLYYIENGNQNENITKNITGR